ncbi:MAG: M23 family metallopeptidase [Caloramator sp.]|nr:M23 family metallopeptidase [Caloramator sp.]
MQWAVKALLTLLPEPDEIIKFIMFILLIPIAFIGLFFVIPITSYKTIPCASPSQVKIYIDTADKVSSGKGILIDWKDVISIDAVILDQDFSKATNSHVEEIAKRFFKEIKVNETYTYVDNDGKVKTGTRRVTKYILKSLNEVASELVNEGILKSEQIDDVLRYRNFDFDSLKDVGSDMPQGWSPIEKDFIWPVPNCFRITSKFGPRIDPVEGIDGFHYGVDIGAPFETQIVAAKDGIVKRASFMGTAGNAVIIVHENGYETRYFHLEKILVKSGQKVAAGTVIGLEGSTGKSTGPHLHFEIRYCGKALDPLTFFN